MTFNNTGNDMFSNAGHNTENVKERCTEVQFSCHRKLGMLEQDLSCIRYRKFCSILYLPVLENAPEMS